MATYSGINKTPLTKFCRTMFLNQMRVHLQVHAQYTFFRDRRGRNLHTLPGRRGRIHHVRDRRGRTIHFIFSLRLDLYPLFDLVHESINFWHGEIIVLLRAFAYSFCLGNRSQEFDNDDDRLRQLNRRSFIDML